jgi:hypothetical protein
MDERQAVFADIGKNSLQNGHALFILDSVDVCS